MDGAEAAVSTPGVVVEEVGADNGARIPDEKTTSASPGTGDADGGEGEGQSEGGEKDGDRLTPSITPAAGSDIAFSASPAETPGMIHVLLLAYICSSSKLATSTLSSGTPVQSSPASGPPIRHHESNFWLCAFVYKDV